MRIWTYEVKLFINIVHSGSIRANCYLAVFKNNRLPPQLGSYRQIPAVFERSTRGTDYQVSSFDLMSEHRRSQGMSVTKLRPFFCFQIR